MNFLIRPSHKLSHTGRVAQPGQRATVIGAAAMLSLFLAACGQRASVPVEQQPDAGSFESLLTTGVWSDLSHDFSADTLYWPTADGFSHTEDFAGMTDKGYYYSSYRIGSSEHGGTHLDAPVHFAEDRHSTDAIPLNRLIGPGAVINVSARTATNADYQVGIEDIRQWERKHGVVPDGAIVLFNTGWHRRWPDAQRYLGTAERGEQAVAKLHFPGIDPQLAQWLIDQRSIAAVGIDTASIDYGQSTQFMTHRILFEQNIPGFENVANLDALPATGALIVALPMKIRGGSGGPLRIVAWVPKP